MSYAQYRAVAEEVDGQSDRGASRSAAVTALREEELRGMKLGALSKLARSQARVTQDALVQALDEDNPKDAVIALVLSRGDSKNGQARRAQTPRLRAGRRQPRAPAPKSSSAAGHSPISAGEPEPEPEPEPRGSDAPRQSPAPGKKRKKRKGKKRDSVQTRSQRARSPRGAASKHGAGSPRRASSPRPSWGAPPPATTSTRSSRRSSGSPRRGARSAADDRLSSGLPSSGQATPGRGRSRSRSRSRSKSAPRATSPRPSALVARRLAGRPADPGLHSRLHDEVRFPTASPFLLV